MPDQDDAELFRIVQVEVPGEVDLGDGRWTVRGHANRARAVVIVETTERPRRRFRRVRGAPDDEAVQLATRLTVVDADPLEARDPERWLARADGAAAVAEAVELLRGLLHLASVAAADPDARIVRARDLTRATIAFGTGSEGAYGRWTSGRAVDLGTGPRTRRTTPGTTSDERLAELLSGRDAVLAAEVLTLRARQDLAAGRVREAALGLRMALEAAIAELEPWRAAPQLDEAIAGLRLARPEVADAAAAAVRGGLDDAQEAVVRAVLRAVATALARRAGGRRVGERLGPPHPA